MMIRTFSSNNRISELTTYNIGKVPGENQGIFRVLVWLVVSLLWPWRDMEGHEFSVAIPPYLNSARDIHGSAIFTKSKRLAIPALPAEIHYS